MHAFAVLVDCPAISGSFFLAFLSGWLFGGWLFSGSLFALESSGCITFGGWLFGGWLFGGGVIVLGSISGAGLGCLGASWFGGWLFGSWLFGGGSCWGSASASIILGVGGISARFANTGIFGFILNFWGLAFNFTFFALGKGDGGEGEERKELFHLWWSSDVFVQFEKIDYNPILIYPNLKRWEPRVTSLVQVQNH